MDLIIKASYTDSTSLNEDECYQDCCLAEHLGKWQTRKVATVQRRMVELERLVLSVTDWDCFTWLA